MGVHPDEGLHRARHRRHVDEHVRGEREREQDRHAHLHDGLGVVIFSSIVVHGVGHGLGADDAHVSFDPTL
jgi:hypothetical protein